MFSLFRKKPEYTRSTSTRKHGYRAQTKASSHIVSHERWVAVDDLEIGMYVSKLSVPWEDTKFMFQGFEIDSMQLLKQVKLTCDEVLVRSEKIANISSSASSRLCAAGR